MADTDIAALVDRLNACAEDYWGALACEAAATITDMQARVKSAESECLEQARIVGAGGERELALTARVRELERVIVDCAIPLEALRISGGPCSEVMSAIIDATHKARATLGDVT